MIVARMETPMNLKVPTPTIGTVESLDPIWTRLRSEAEAVVAGEPALAGLVYTYILNHARLEDSVAHRIADRLDGPAFDGDLINRAFNEMLAGDHTYPVALRADLVAVYDRDPAVTRFLEPVLYFKGFHAIQTHRLAHWLYGAGRRDFALYLQSQASQVFQVDINPRVPMGRGIFIDHATGVVVGETAVIEDDVSILQNVTLGGTGKETGDRHPKIRRGVLIGAGAKILGNIEIGRCSRVAAGSVVLKPVPPNATVAGVPARVVGQAGCAEPARSMDQVLRDSETDSDIGFGI
jgi:serine O-acetyltransferase